MFSSIVRLFALATLLLAALARAQQQAVAGPTPGPSAAQKPGGIFPTTPIRIKNEVQAEGGCIAFVTGPLCGDITIQPGAIVERPALCKPEHAHMRCVGPASTGPKVFQCNTRFTGKTHQYAVEGFSFAANGGDAKCTLVRN